jgi:hypothetical protein
MEDCIDGVIAAGVVRISFTDTADVPDQVIAPHDGDSPAVAFLGTVDIDECGCGHATGSIGAKTPGVYWALGQRRTAPRGVRTGRGDVVRRDGMLIEPRATKASGSKSTPWPNASGSTPRFGLVSTP